MGTEANKDAVDPEKMTNTEMHAHFTKLVVEWAHDVDTRLDEAMEKIGGIEDTLAKQLGDILSRLPQWHLQHLPHLLHLQPMSPMLQTR